LQSYTTRCFIIVFYLATSFGPEYGPSSGYYEGWNFNSGNYLFTTDTK